MKPWIWLRVAAGLYAFFAIGHTYGFNFYPSRGPDESSLFSAMQTYTFQMQGFTRSHWDAYRGFGHLFTASLVFLAVLSWQVAKLSKAHPAGTRPLVGSLLLISAAFAALSWAYFFTAPATTATLATLCIAGAAMALRRA